MKWLEENGKYLRSCLPWLVLFLALDVFFSFLLWVARADALPVLLTLIFLFTAVVFCMAAAIYCRREQKKKRAYEEFLASPDPGHERELCSLLSPAEKEKIHLLGEELRRHLQTERDQEEQMNGYQEYVESWAHEIKNPLALLTMILDNHREELPEEVAYRLDYARSRMQEQIDQMLYYARLRGTRQDYLLEKLSLRDCIEEVLEDYRPLLEEKEIRVMCFLGSDPDVTVLADKRGLQFILSQAVSNSIKYTEKMDGNEIPTVPTLTFNLERGERLVLCIRDNGRGVRACDLPFVFEKGFTGGGAMTKRATGMGLYLAREVARSIGLTLEADSEWGEGFELRIGFPVV